MSASPSSDEIMAAIRASGYLMEQEVATQLERHGFGVRTNVAFEDPEEKKSREIDVKAIKRAAVNESSKLGAFVELLVECKNSSNPFVFIARPKNNSDHQRGPEEFLFPFKYSMSKNLDNNYRTSRSIPAFKHLGYDKIYDAHIHPWKAVQFCRIDRNGKSWQANHGGLYDSIFYPMAKALNVRRKEIPKASLAGDWNYIWLFFPIVVTSGDIFLIDSSSEKQSPNNIDYVTFMREIKSEKITGSFTITFVRQQALDAFISSVIDPLAELSANLIGERQDFFMNTDLPWID